ncbi:hypothetical protein AQUCO_01400162v1 [Aquilegia coerulea]|uniref:WIBG Mago-binding domain-containing protein n=1 Tax=Aquilegia coerulea TaxID=218851 RepID=A0A2G5DUV2_AQUCA|nr:hypothetical protein AQUCO_01400162v1 [Aquilegia coerulea]
MANNGTKEEQLNRIGKTLKEGERILAPTRRPDGTLRKPIRIRAGYTPQDEVAIYQSKGALLKKGKPEIPPGYDPVDAKPKTKAAKRNERKKEKKQQAAVEKGKDIGFEAVESKSKEVSSENGIDRSKVIESVACQMNTLSVSETSSLPDLTENSNPGIPGLDLDKRIRALKKKIRLTESQQQKTDREEMKPELLEKVEKLDDWRQELKLLEDKKAGLSLS